MKVIATKTGFDGKRIRNPGDEFEMPDGSKASWFVPVEAKAETKPKKAAGKPETADPANPAADLT